MVSLQTPRWQRGILCVFYMDFCTHPPPLKSFILTAAMPQPPTCLDLSIIYTWAVMHLNFRKIKVDISAAFLTDRMEKGGSCSRLMEGNKGSTWELLAHP